MEVISDRLKVGLLEFRCFSKGKHIDIRSPIWNEVEQHILDSESHEIAGLYAHVITFNLDGSFSAISNLTVDSDGEYHLVTYVGDEDPDYVRTPIKPNHDDVGTVSVGGNPWNKSALVKGKGFLLKVFKYYIETGYFDPELMS
ncbi:MAG: hypothetical protein IPK50_07800 [Fibrobacterota bacterium]|nr:MAG: hypothetical protein IPK50_07800 [Fibrobacterota bacterium]